MRRPYVIAAGLRAALPLVAVLITAVPAYRILSSYPVAYLLSRPLLLAQTFLPVLFLVSSFTGIGVFTVSVIVYILVSSYTGTDPYILALVASLIVPYSVVDNWVTSLRNPSSSVSRISPLSVTIALSYRVIVPLLVALGVLGTYSAMKYMAATTTGPTSMAMTFLVSALAGRVLLLATALGAALYLSRELFSTISALFAGTDPSLLESVRADLSRPPTVLSGLLLLGIRGSVFVVGELVILPIIYGSLRLVLVPFLQSTDLGEVELPYGFTGPEIVALVAAFVISIFVVWSWIACIFTMDPLRRRGLLGIYLGNAVLAGMLFMMIAYLGDNPLNPVKTSQHLINSYYGVYSVLRQLINSVLYLLGVTP